MSSKVTPIVYIDSENFLFKVADVLKNHRLIKHKNEITNFDFKHLMETTLPDKNLDIRYYSASARLIRTPRQLKTKTSRIIRNRRALKNVLQKQGVEAINAGRAQVT